MCCIDCHCIYYRLTVEPPLHSCERWRVNFTLLTANFTAVMEGLTTSTLNKDPKDQESQESLIGANWPSLPVPANSQNSQEKQEDQESQIQPGQKTPKTIPWKSQQRGPEDYERDRVGKYAQYFKGNEILPIPEIVEQLEPRILSLVVLDIKTKRLVGLKKEIFEDLLRKAGIPCQYFCRKVLLLGMSCFLQRNKPPRPQSRISWLKTSGYSRSIKAPVGCV